MTKYRGVVLLLVILLFSACKSKTTEVSQPTPQDIIPIPTTEDLLEEEDLPETEVLTTLSADPVQLIIPTEDGRDLSAIFFPAEVRSAPVVVLMHWYPGDQNECRSNRTNHPLCQSGTGQYWRGDGPPGHPPQL